LETRVNRTLSIALLAVLAFGIGGCGDGKPSGSGPTEPSQSDILMEVAGLIRNHTAAKGKGPQKIADLAPYETEYQRGFAAVKSGAVVVLWGGTVAGEGGGGGGKTVVAHLKDVPTAGGEVALESGVIVTMSATEFASAPKPGKN
jgi:hypothetical protein